MRKEVADHLLYHFLQVSVLAVGFIAFIRLQGDLRIQILLFSIICYIFIGLLHQYINHNLHLKIVIEYVLMGALSASIILFVLEGGIGI